MDRRAIDWTVIAHELRAIDQEGGERGSSAMARQALEIILGEETCRDAVEFYLPYQRGSELVRHVLWLLHPWSAMQHCYQICKSDRSLEQRIAAVELLRVVADERALEWIPEFLNEPDPGIQNGGIGVLDQLLWGGGVAPDRCVALLDMARNHSNPAVREQAGGIDDFLKARRHGV